MRRIFVSVGVILLLAASAAMAGQYRYKVRDLRELGFANAWALNNRGHILGYASSVDGSLCFFDGKAGALIRFPGGVRINSAQLNDEDQVFLYGAAAAIPASFDWYKWEAGVLQPLAGMSGQNLRVKDINRYGQAILGPTDSAVGIHYLYDPKAVPALARLADDDPGITANALNSSGTVAGRDSGPMLWNGATAYSLRDLTGLPDLDATPLDINDSGVCVGYFSAENATRAFIYSFGRILGVDAPRHYSPPPPGTYDFVGPPYGSAKSLNNYNVLVGSSDSNGAFLWSGGRRLALGALVDYKSAGFDVMPTPEVINDRGEILASGSIASRGVPVLLEPVPLPGIPGHLASLSLRGVAGEGTHTCVTGFSLSGDGGRVLVRASGPALAYFGLKDAIPDPSLALYLGQEIVARNDDWEAQGQPIGLASAFNRLKAFSFTAGGKDSALMATLPSGTYTVHAKSAGAEGIVLAEIYDANDAYRPDAHLHSMSGRVYVGTGDRLGVAGFVIAGDTPCKVLVRAVGPGLAQFGIADYLRDPALRVYSSDSTAILGNDNWGSAEGCPLLTENMKRVGEFPLADNSRDAALQMQLEPGSYTVHVSGADGGTGVALIEVYEIPDGS